MNGMGYQLHRLPQQQQRRLVRNLMATILRLLQATRRPMRDTEIISTLAQRLQRYDTDFRHQVRLNLEDGVAYGLLRRQANAYGLRGKQVATLMQELAPKKSN
ncbi:CG15578 [Drosophila busckii]|uniref:CG15578 n=1 Tax=Drosophila busckii TaxID=30019 RepID=A0A0M4FA09_DROBS|nr:uncharacterized protein LOC108607211 [Drosophila busckii]ALC49487.1 CG15578 [Drosophila busckii]